MGRWGWGQGGVQVEAGGVEAGGVEAGWGEGMEAGGGGGRWGRGQAGSSRSSGQAGMESCPGWGPLGAEAGEKKAGGV